MNKILSFFITLFIFIYPINSIASSTKSIGEKGDPKNIDRVIKIKMYDNYYEPNLITIKKGETIKFIITNHEIITFDKIDKKKMKEMSKKDHSLAHSHSNSIMLEPKTQGEIIWKFSKDIELEMACNIPGHYESGMISKIEKISL